MKNNGFTLAEILVTLGVIGVVASLTIPVFTTDIQRQQMDARLRTSESVLSSAFSLMMLKEDTESLQDTEWYTLGHSNQNKQTEASEELSKYLKISNFYKSDDAKHFSDSLSLSANRCVKKSTTVQLKNGAMVCFSNIALNGSNDDLSLNKIAGVYVDVNGTARPNRAGTDIFAFMLAEDGMLYPCGSDKVGRINHSSDVCTDALNETARRFERSGS